MYKGDLVKRENGWMVVYSTPNSGKISEIKLSQESVDLIYSKYGHQARFIPDIKFSYSIKDGDAVIIFDGCRQKNTFKRKKINPSTTKKAEPNKISWLNPLWEDEPFSDNDPFSVKETQIMQCLVTAYEDFSSLDQTHPNDITDFVFHIHALQRILGQRVLRRDYPNIFPTHK